MSLLLAIAVIEAAMPHPPQLNTFGDWIVGCDNGRACEARALIPVETQAEWSVLELHRGPEPDAAPTLSVAVQNPATARVLVAGRDRQPLPADRTGVISVPAAFVPKVIRALRSEPGLKLLDPTGQVSSRISLKGASAALLWIDEQQKRLGTDTGLARPGGRAASAPPRPPSLPVVVVRAAPSGKPAARLTAKALQQAYGGGGCGKDDTQKNAPPTYARLDARQTLALVPQVCASGAYNFEIDARVITDGKENAPEPAAYERVFGDEKDGGSVENENTSWDPKARRLHTGMKGRGLSDCGLWRDYAWDGARFRLIGQQEMSECRGAADPIPTWRAVVRGP